MKRRDFLKSTAVGAGMMGTSRWMDLSAFDAYSVKQNKLPRWRGFNILDFFTPERYSADAKRMAATEQDFKWMADWGFDFVRIPIAYPSYL